ncbi:hypothetical protein GCM10009759_71140 [Kitasatospora saccharophila]|uniref:Uncharacterized protein n=1 Tax=Kitasatospora saccharophila TaxID=407973 RepID=A0ABP5JQV3_9ACTN
MYAALLRLVRRSARRPAQVRDEDDLPSVYLPAIPEPAAPTAATGDGPTWWSWPEDLAVHPLLAAAEQAADAAYARLLAEAENA